MNEQQFNGARRQLFTRQKKHQIDPLLPWLKSAQFLDKCTQCRACIEACPQQIIKAASGGFPSIDFQIDECTFCYQCAKSCPQDLFHPQTQAPWQAKATISNQCLAVRNIDCRSCGDSCPQMAIRFQPQVAKVAQLALDLDLCNGCGACVSVCPTSAIEVQPGSRASTY